MDFGNFPPRWECGDWPQWLGWLHILTDIGIGTHYAIVAFLIAWYGYRSGISRPVQALAVIFFLLCGGDHWQFAGQFWLPNYPSHGVWKAAELVSVFGFVFTVLRWEIKRWRTPAQLAHDHAKLLAIADASDPFWIVDLEGRADMVNRPLLELTGWAESELIGQNMHTVLHHSREDGSAYPLEECDMFRAMKERRITRNESDVIWGKDGKQIRVSWVSTPVRVGGEVIGTRIEATPLSAADVVRLMVGQNVGQDAANLRCAFRMLPLTAAVLDQSGKTIAVTQAWSDLTGSSRSVSLGRFVTIDNSAAQVTAEFTTQLGEKISTPVKAEVIECGSESIHLLMVE